MGNGKPRHGSGRQSDNQKKANNSYRRFHVDHGENSRRCRNKACIIKC